MRCVLAVFLLMLATTANGQAYWDSYAEVDPPEYLIAIIHPTLPAKVYNWEGILMGPVPVRVGTSEWAEGGGCQWAGLMPDADAIVVFMDDGPYHPQVLEIPLPLEQPSDETGWTTVDLAGLRGGGNTYGNFEPAFASVAGHLGCWDYPFFIQIRSPDFNRDLVVDLADVVTFCQILGSHYAPWGDLHPDGIIDLADAAVMSWALLEQ